MALPKSLVGQANANVSQALQTGARGQTTTHTDYGVIGDAFFKKAQMDLQIADLQADMGYKKASLLSGLEMQRASLELESGKLKLTASQMAEEQRRYEESQEVSDSEGLMGALSGAMSGAVAGATVGSVVPGIGTMVGAIGGAAIGGLTTYNSYKQGGRQAGQQAQQTLGTIAGAATTLKGLHQESVREDSWKGIMKSGGDLIAQYNSAQTPQEQYQAQQGLDAHIGEVYQTAMSMPGANPEKVGTMVANYRKGLEASVGMPTNEAARQNQFRQLENTVQYQADPRANDPKQQRAWANDYIKDASAIYEETTGKQMPMSVGMKMAKQMSAQAGRVLEQQVSGGNGAFGSMPVPQSTGGAQTYSPSASQQATLDTTQREQAPVAAPTPERSLPVGMGGGIPWRPMVASGPGIEMDDGGGFQPVKAEQDLAKQGTEVVKMGVLDKIKHNLSLSDEEFDAKKAPLWEDRNMTEDGSEEGAPIKKVSNYDEFKEMNAEIDQRISEAAGSSPEGTRARGAVKQVDKMIELVEGETFPAGSQTKAFGAKIYNDGLNVGGIAGAGVGAAVAGGRGAAAGAFLGSQQDLKVGEGMGPFLDDDEELAVSAMEKYKAAATMKFAKIQDPGGKISDADAKRFENLWPRPGQSREQQLAGLLTIKEMMADELGGAMEAESSERAMKLEQYEEKEKIKARYKKPTAKKAGRYVNDFFDL